MKAWKRVACFKVSACLAVAGLMVGCATPQWARDEEWRKKTKWEDERVENPGLLGALLAALSLINGK